MREAMGEQLYGLTAATADALRGVLRQGGATGGRQTAGTEGRTVTWVKVTGAAPDADGFYTGTVSTTSGPGWDDGTVEVLVGGPWDAPAELVEGARYLCTRSGSRVEDGKARFRAMESPKAENLCKSLLVGKGADSTFRGVIPVGLGQCDNVGPGLIRFVWAADVGESGGWRSGPFTTAAGPTVAALFLDRNGDQRCVLTATVDDEPTTRGMTLEGCLGARIKFTIAGCLWCDSDWLGPCAENKFYIIVECAPALCGGNVYPPTLTFTIDPVPDDGAVPWFEFPTQKSFFEGVTFDVVELVLDGDLPTFTGAGDDYPIDGTDDASFGAAGDRWPLTPTVDPSAGSTYWGSGFMEKPNGRRVRFVLEVWIESSGSGDVCFSGGLMHYAYDFTNTFDDAVLAPHTYQLQSLPFGAAHASNFLPPSYPWSGDDNVPGVSFDGEVGHSYSIPVTYTVTGIVPGDGEFEPCPEGGPEGVAPSVEPDAGGTPPPEPEPGFSFTYP